MSDWPVRDMDKERHLIPDKGFDVFERASYGHGCEIGVPPEDEKNQKCKKAVVKKYRRFSRINF